MLSWCFKNGFKAPPPNFTPPKPLKQCTQPITKWCSSRAIASSCNVSHKLKTVLGKLNVYLFVLFHFRWRSGVSCLIGQHHNGTLPGHGKVRDFFTYFTVMLIRQFSRLQVDIPSMVSINRYSKQMWCKNDLFTFSFPYFRLMIID